MLSNILNVSLMKNVFIFKAFSLPHVVYSIYYNNIRFIDKIHESFSCFKIFSSKTLKF